MENTAVNYFDEIVVEPGKTAAKLNDINASEVKVITSYPVINQSSGQEQTALLVELEFESQKDLDTYLASKQKVARV